MTLLPRLRRHRRMAVTTSAVLATLALVAGTGSAHAGPPAPADERSREGLPAELARAAASPPTLTPADGAFVEGTIAVRSDATSAGDDVASLTVDGARIPATETPGSSRLSFEVGDNSIESRYGNYVLINGQQRIELPDAVSERVVLQVPNDALVSGSNTVEFFTGTVTSSCGLNNDDFTVSEVRLELLGETADGEENEFTYAMGDGNCGSNTSLLTQATLSFFVKGQPGSTTGLAAQLDTRALSNGRHTLAATTASGATTSHVLRVNNSPVGAPRISPADGTLVRGQQTVVAANSVSGGGSIGSLLIDGAVPPAATTLAAGDAALRFTVGSNSIEARYYNHLEVNGHRVEIGGEWVSQTVTVPVPRHYLVDGPNVVRLVTGDVNSGSGATLCANRDDFVVSNLQLVVDGGTVTPVGNAASYNMGDGTCGNSPTSLPEATLRYTVSGVPTTRTQPTLGAGDAHLRMFVGGNGTEARYYNHLLVNGNRLDLTDYAGVTADLTIPNEWLVPGINVVEVVAGAITTDCGQNYDDYTLGDVVLTPASGTAALTYRARNAAGAAVPIAIGDGTCSSSFTGTLHVGLTFKVDAPAQGLRADVRTAELADGEHTISATSSGGQTATRTLVTDNTAPVVARSVPSAGQRITSAVAFDLELSDLAGVAGTPVTTLDGAPIALGDPIGPGLAAGEHTLAVQATDALGNTATRQIVFTSAGIPDEPAQLTPVSGTTGVGRSVDLSAQVTVPGGGDVTATFTAADVVVPKSGFQGTAAAVPTTLRVAGEKQVDTASLAPLGSGDLASPAGRDVTFQRYDLPVAGAAGAPTLRWTGTVDPERVAALRAWNAATGTWDVLASARGALQGDTVLTVTAPARYVDGDTVHVMVTGEDPFADDIDPGSPDGFADPSTYDFSLVHFTDTQYLSEGAVEQETEAERAIWKAAYGATTEWIAEQAEARKIAYVAHTGDIIENNIDPPTTPERAAQITGEFEVSSELQGTLDAAGVPNQVIAGNHDNQRGRETGPGSIYNTYYGPERYQAADDAWGTASYGGPWREGDNQNNYVLFSAGGLEFVAVGLSYGVTRAEADWADSIFKRFPERNGIVLSHDYLKPSTNPDGRGAAFAAPDGSMLYKLVVEDNPNVFLVLAGHEHGVGTNLKAGVGPTVTHDVVEMLADYQFYTVSADRLGLTEIGGYQPTDRLRFGASFLRMLQFDVERGEMIVDTYSPFLDEFGATEYDEDHRYDGTEDNMVLPVDLTSRTTSFTTDDIAAFVPREVVGTDTVASGEVATTTWTGLRPATTYGWVVSATSPGGGRATAEPGVFRTMAAPAASVGVTDRSAAYGAEVQVPVTVTATDRGDGTGAAEPVDGQVEIREGTRLLGTAPVVNGTATVTVPAGLTPGAHRLTASYTGAGWVGDGQSELVLTIGKAPAAVAATAPTVASGTRPVVDVKVDGSGLTPTGQVRVSEGSELLGTATLTDGGARVELTRTLDAGRHELTVEYLGSERHETATATTTLVVGKVRTSVSATAPRVESGQEPVVTVEVDGGDTPATGEVRVSEGGRVLGTASLSGGTARVVLPRTLAAGEHTLTVDYLGSDEHAASSTTTTLTVAAKARVASTTTVRATPGSVRRGGMVTFAVTVRARGTTPTGRVTLVRGGRELAARTLAGGRTTFRARLGGPTGRRTFTVRYLGSGTVLASRDVVTVRVRR